TTNLHQVIRLTNPPHQNHRRELRLAALIRTHHASVSLHFTHHTSERPKILRGCGNEIANHLQSISHYPAHSVGNPPSGSACDDSERRQRDGANAWHDEWANDANGIRRRDVVRCNDECWQSGGIFIKYYFLWA